MLHVPFSGRRVSCRTRMSKLFSVLAAKGVARFALNPSMFHCKMLRDGVDENEVVLSIGL